MAETLAVAGGIASTAQILGAIVSTTQYVSNVIHDFSNAPDELLRTHARLKSLQEAIRSTESVLIQIPDEEILPTELAQCITQVFGSLKSTTQEVINKTESSRFQEWPNRTSKSIALRLKFAVLDKRSVNRLTQRLAISEQSLNNIIGLINLRLHLLKYTSSGVSQSPVPCSMATGIPMSIRRSVILKVDSCLRKLGFYGHLIIREDRSGASQNICFGFCPPAWLWPTSLELQLMNTTTKNMCSQSLSWTLHFNSRVPVDMPFMKACREGDVVFMRQHLCNGTGSLRFRTDCRGKTPLLLALDSRNLDAVQFLLEEGADPSIGDDDQVVPVFTVLGVDPHRSKAFPQLPPQWSHWLNALQLLVNRGASIHETRDARPIGTFDITRHDLEPRALGFFSLLQSEHYLEFDAMYGNKSRSAIETAVRARQQSLDALKVLKASGVDFSRIMADGRTALHLAAELAESSEVLDYLCLHGCKSYLNRGDHDGWTPLHWSLLSEYFGRRPFHFEKVKFLLRNGANPYRRSFRCKFFPLEEVAGLGSCDVLSLAASLTPSVYNGLIQAMKDIGLPISPDADEDVFTDAAETLT